MKTIRELFQKVPNDGDVRHALRTFNLAQRSSGKVQSVKKLAESCGLIVMEEELPANLRGQLVQETFSDSGYAIHVNKNDGIRVKRWTVLHELGHFLLHTDRSDPLEFSKNWDMSGETFYIDTKEETEANQFAEVLLFGDNVLTTAVSSHGRDPKKLSDVFAVTENTMRIALKRFMRN